MKRGTAPLKTDMAKGKLISGMVQGKPGSSLIQKPKVKIRKPRGK